MAFPIIGDLLFMVSVAANMHLYAEGDYPFPKELDVAVPVSMYREFYRDDGKGKCKFKGLLVPVAREWPLITKTEDTEIIQPPEPDKTYATGFLINQRICKDKEPEAVMHVGYWHRTTGTFYDLTSIRTTNLKIVVKPGDKPPELPQWAEQALNRVARVATQGNPDAQAFLTFSAADLHLLRAAKQVQADAPD